MTALERIVHLLHKARVAGGWDDETVGAAILAELGLNDDGAPLDTEPTSPNLGHG